MDSQLNSLTLQQWVILSVVVLGGVGAVLFLISGFVALVRALRTGIGLMAAIMMAFSPKAHLLAPAVAAPESCGLGPAEPVYGGGADCGSDGGWSAD
jgi:hypothetical protein